MDEIDRHYMVSDRPGVFKCKCGVISYIFEDGSEKISSLPRNIHYLVCGHAECAQTDEYECIICVRERKVK